MHEYSIPRRRRVLVAVSLSTAAIVWTGLAAIALATPTHAGLGQAIATDSSAARIGAATPSAEAFDWTGIFDVVGTGFPDGERRAVMAISPQDTSYTLHMLQGPPGDLKSLKVKGDSANVVWDLGPEEMFIDLRGIGDSLMGEWSTSDWRGDVRGLRRR
jgi:hypothetical protein